MTSPSVQQSRVTFWAGGRELKMLALPHQLHTLKALVEQWNAAHPDGPVFVLDVHHAKKQPHRAIKVLTNQWGNMSGYISGKRLMEFGSPTFEARERATAWVSAELKKANSSISPCSEVTLQEVKTWEAREE